MFAAMLISSRPLGKPFNCFGQPLLDRDLPLTLSEQRCHSIISVEAQENEFIFFKLSRL
jgi:hypothetical protein